MIYNRNGWKRQFNKSLYSGCTENQWIWYGCGFDSSCSKLNFKFHACFEQGVPWHSGNYSAWIHSETRTWHYKNIPLFLVLGKLFYTWGTTFIAIFFRYSLVSRSCIFELKEQNESLSYDCEIWADGYFVSDKVVWRTRTASLFKFCCSTNKSSCIWGKRSQTNT